MDDLTVLLVGYPDLETAAQPVVAVAAFRDAGAHELAQQTLQRVADLGMVCRGRRQGAAMASNQKAALLLGDLGQAAELIQQGARAGHPLPQSAPGRRASVHQPASYLMHHRVE